MSNYNIGGLVGVPTNFKSTQDNFMPKESLTPSKPLSKITLPFRKEYNVLFHRDDSYKISLNATSEGLHFLLISLFDHKMWKGEFPSEYLEDISRKTGRELSFI